MVLVRPDTRSAALDSERRTLALAEAPVPVTVVGDVAYPVDRVADWDLVVGTARASGAGLVHLEGGCDHAVVPFLSIAAAAGWEPIVVTGPAAYDPACLAASELTGRLLVEVPFLPYEDGDAAPVTAEHAGFLDALGGPRTGDALLAASAFWRWVTAAAACGTDLDRECLADQAATIDAWTGAGLHPAVGLDGSMEPCVVVLGVEDGEFVRRLPTEPGTYDCTPEWSVSLSG
ncbi:MAG: hypothetical protein GWN25_28305 [Actinobacteria bacterium]|nr:hypothetical protein [Actinomycetota bacterium]